MNKPSIFRNYLQLHSLLISLSIITFSSFVFANELNDKFLGKWMLNLQQPGGDLIGLLELKKEGNDIFGYVEGGPIGVAIDGMSIELTVDSRDVAARKFDRILKGTLQQNKDGDIQIAGTYISTAAGAEKIGPRNWSATVNIEPQQDKKLAPKPVDFSGIWTPGPGIDLRKYHMDTTAEAEAFVSGYDPNMDQPPLRCLSPGLVQLFGYPYPLEFVHAKDRIFIINEGFGQVRQIYMDGRSAPDYYPESLMGFSVGHWDGSELVVETTKLQANIRDFRGEPLSGETRVEERYTLSDDGNSLFGVLKIFDPENYKQPPIRRTVRNRNTDVVILPYECDPDSFYRQLDQEDKMDEYWSRTDKRL